MDLKDLDYQKRCRTYQQNDTFIPYPNADLSKLMTVRLLRFPPLLDLLQLDPDHEAVESVKRFRVCGPLHELLVQFARHAHVPYRIDSFVVSASDLAEEMIVRGPTSENHLDIVTIYPPVREYYGALGEVVSDCIAYDGIDTIISRMVPPYRHRFAFVR